MARYQALVDFRDMLFGGSYKAGEIFDTTAVNGANLALQGVCVEVKNDSEEEQDKPRRRKKTAKTE